MEFLHRVFQHLSKDLKSICRFYHNMLEHLVLLKLLHFNNNRKHLYEVRKYLVVLVHHSLDPLTNQQAGSLGTLMEYCMVDFLF